MLEFCLYTAGGIALIAIIIFLSTMFSLQYGKIFSIFIIISILFTFIFELANNSYCKCLSFDSIVFLSKTTQFYLNEIFTSNNIRILLRLAAITPFLYALFKTGFTKQLFLLVVDITRVLLLSVISNIICKVYLNCIACPFVCNQSIDEKLVRQCVSENIQKELIETFGFLVDLFLLAIS